MQHFHQNALTHRLERVYSFWDQHRQNDETLIFRWLVKRDEIAMIDGFYRIEATQEGYTNDIFLRFATPFVSAATYSAHLTEELRLLWEEQKEGLAQKGIDISWSFDREAISGSDEEVFFYHLNSLCNALNIEQCVVLFLAPEEIRQPEGLAIWLGKAKGFLSSGHRCLMFIDEEEQEILQKFSEKNQPLITTLVPDLEMKKAMTQLAASGDPNSPDTQFRTCYLQLAQAATTKDIEQVKQYGAKALSIASAPGWEAVKTGVRILMANAFTDVENYKEAQFHYSAGCKEAGALLEEEPQQAKKLMAQCLTGKGNVHFTGKQYKEATTEYLQAGQYALEAAEYFYAMEAWRMAGHCFQKIKKADQSLDCYQKAFEAAIQLPPDIARSSTFPMIGEELCRLSNDKAEKRSVRQAMNRIMGHKEDIPLKETAQA